MKIEVSLKIRLKNQSDVTEVLPGVYFENQIHVKKFDGTLSKLSFKIILIHVELSTLNAL